MDTVKLIDGCETSPGLVRAVQLGARTMMDKGLAIPLYEAVQLARDPSHTLFGRSGDILADLGWIDPFAQGVQLHKGVAEILRNMASGDGLDLSFVDPIAHP
jgi:hypothetical protein